ncbi:MAG: hypothetical protein G01um101430_103 [Parcubacteria group bacterium Gr01-1014_30]|nr:MAG: hypothetical protein G01um101430_103 [Parcubacteria group bacterium Gr01-1014_30]
MAKILIVEDEKLLGEMYKDKLEALGHEVVLVLSSEDALDYVNKETPDFILLDIILPKASGIDFLRAAMRIKSIAKVPVVVFSNYDDPATKKEALKLGVKAYLIKSQYTPQGMLEEVEKFL